MRKPQKLIYRIGKSEVEVTGDGPVQTMTWAVSIVLVLRAFALSALAWGPYMIYRIL